MLLVALAAVVVGLDAAGLGPGSARRLFAAAAAHALVGGLGASATAERFVEGTAGIAGGALVVGLARGVLVIFDGAGGHRRLLDAMAGAVCRLAGVGQCVGDLRRAGGVELRRAFGSGRGGVALADPGSIGPIWSA